MHTDSVGSLHSSQLLIHHAHHLSIGVEKQSIDDLPVLCPGLIWLEDSIVDQSLSILFRVDEPWIEASVSQHRIHLQSLCKVHSVVHHLETAVQLVTANTKRIQSYG